MRGKRTVAMFDFKYSLLVVQLQLITQFTMRRESPNVKLMLHQVAKVIFERNDLDNLKIAVEMKVVYLVVPEL
jgi:hypothetical protein